MPVNPTYPGVYVQELPTTTGILPAATNVTAFVGRAPFGSTKQVGSAFSFADFTRLYGGLAANYPVSYAVQDFFRNGGTQALIVRLFQPSTGPGDGIARLTSSATPLILKAASPGLWGNFLAASVDTTGIDAAAAAKFTPFAVSAGDLFNLTLALKDSQGEVVCTERFTNLTVKATGQAADFPNRIDYVLSAQSTLARVENLSTTPPPNGATAAGTGGGDGDFLTPQTYIGDRSSRTGMFRLENIPAFNLLCIPPDQRITATLPLPLQDLDPAVRQAAASYATDRNAIYIVDPPAGWTTLATQGNVAGISLASLGISGDNQDGKPVARNAAVYFPRLQAADPLQADQVCTFAPCGAVAGIIAANDLAKGVWTAPAGISATINGISDLELPLNDNQDGLLNPQGINCLRKLPTIGPVVWGARTLRGADPLDDDYKYLPVRRLAIFIETSIYQGTLWAVFESNNAALWSRLQGGVSAFLSGLQAQGALYGFVVMCDASTTTPADIANGVVNIVVQIAPVRPAEFLVIYIQQRAGQVSG